MKLTCLLVAIGCTSLQLLMANAGKGQELRDVRVSLELKNEPLRAAFSMIEKQTDYRFAYNRQQVDNYRSVSLSRGNYTVEKALELLLTGTRLQYRQVNNKIIIYRTGDVAGDLADGISGTAGQPADGGVKGKITNEKNEPMVGASVLLAGADKGISAGLTGEFSIGGVKPGRYKLQVSAIGYQTILRDITVSDGQVLELNFQLKPGGDALNEVVVTGYSRQSKRDVTGAVSTVPAEVIAQTPVTDIGTALQGRVAGVSVDNQGGPGSAGTVRIRGVGTLNNNDPLYVIDGVQIRLGENTGSGSQNIANLLNPSDIESITVLKDPSTTALYGAAGGNGVIVITTKSGKLGAPKLEYSTYLGAEMPIKLPAIMNPQQYANAYWGYLENSGLSRNSTLYGNGASPVLPAYIIQNKAFPNDPKGVQAGDPAADPSLYNLSTYRISKANQQGTDWFRQVFKSAFLQSHQLSLSGASDKSNYALTFNYINEKGTLLYTYFRRYTLRTNTEFKIKPWFRVGENMLFSYTENSGLGNNHSSSNDVSNLYVYSPLLPVRDIAGNLTGTKYGGGTDGIGSLIGSNPIFSRQASLNGHGFSAGIIGSSYAEIEPLKNLVFQTKIGVQFLPYSSRLFTDTFPQERYSQTTNSFFEGSGYSTDWRWTNKISYDLSINNIHRISAFVAYEAHQYTFRYTGGTTQSLLYTVPSYQYLGNGVSYTGNTVIVSGGGDKYTTASAFGNVNYSLMDKYLFSFVLRRDGSSKFGPAKVYGVFPGGSAGWRISRERFMDNIKWISDLKLRASYGTVGNDGIPSGAYLAQFIQNPYVTNYALNGSNISSSAGFALLQQGNPNLHWETNQTTNIGLDASLFNNSLTVTFNWYNRITKDLLYAPPSTQTAGTALPPIENVMKFSNKGIELELGYSGGRSSLIRWEMNLNFATYHNKVLYISGSPSDSTIGIGGNSYSSSNHYILTRSVVGRPVSSFYGYQQTGIFQTPEEYTSANITYPGIAAAENAPGHFKFKDISGPGGKPDGKIDQNDRTFIGSPIPKFSYGYNLNLYYKHFDLGVFVQGVYGNKIFNYWRESSEWPGALGIGSLDTWSPAHKNAKLPIWSNNVSVLDNNPSSFFVEGGSYLRVKTVQLGYTFPRIKGISRLRLYVQAFNLFTATHYSGIDPEVNSGNPVDIGVDFGGTYPVAKKVLFGVNMGL